MANAGGGSKLTVDASDFVSGMTSAARASGQLQSALNSLVGSAKSMNDAVQRSASATKQLGEVVPQVNALTAAVQASHQVVYAMASIRLAEHFAREFRDATKEAAQFQKSIALIQTITQDANLTQQEWASGIEKVANQLGKPVADVAAASYDLLSNQVTKAADTFEVVQVAGELAKATNSSTTDSVNALSTAYNAFGLKSYELRGVAGEFFSVIDQGRVKMDALANSSGRPFLFGKSLGASMREIDSAVVALTQSGIQENTAYTLITNVFQKLLNPTKDLEATYRKWGVSSGDMAYKTFGLVGILEKLREETGGSASALAKFFNELKGEQGVSALIDKLDVVKSAMSEASKSAGRYREANRLVGGTEGNTFEVQYQTMLNNLTTGLKTNLLEIVVHLSKDFGSLTDAVHAAIEGTVTFAAVLGSLKFGAIAYDAWAAGALNAANATKTLTTGTIALGAASAGVLALVDVMLKLKARSDEAYASIRAATQARADLEQASYNEGLRGSTEAFGDQLKTAIQGRLGDLADLRKGIDQVADSVDEVGNKFRESFKNAGQLAMSAVRDGLQQTTSDLHKAITAIGNIDKDKAGAKKALGDALYGARQTANEVGHPGTDTQSIQEKINNDAKLARGRLEQNMRELMASIKKGDEAAFTQAMQDRQQFLSQLSSETFTDADGVTRQKYLGIERALTAEYELQINLIDQMGEKKKKQLHELEAQRILEQGLLKDIEDASEKLYKDLKPTDSKGRVKDRQAIDSEARRDIANLDRLYKELQSGRGEKATGLPTSIQELQGKRIADALRKAEEARVAAGRGSDAAKDQETAGKIGEAYDRSMKEAQESLKKQAQNLSDLKKETLGYKTELISLLNLLQESKVGDSPLLDQAQKLIESGKIDEGIAKLRDYQKLFQSISPLDVGNAPLWDQWVNKGGDYVRTKQVVEDVIQNARILKGHTDELQAAEGQLASNSAKIQAAQANPVIESIRKMIDGNSELISAAEGSADAISHVYDSTHAALEQAKQSADDLIQKLGQIGQMQSPLAGATAPASSWGGDEGDTGESAGSYATGGLVKYFARGGLASAFAAQYSKGTDTIPAMLSAGERVIRNGPSQRFGPLLDRMNAGYYSDGGEVGDFPGSLSLMNPAGGSQQGISNTTNVGDIHLNVQNGGTAPQTLNNVVNSLQRGIRRGTIKLR